jgi:purine-nucleoside phosphorylase
LSAPPPLTWSDPDFHGRLEEAAAFLEGELPEAPAAALVLGSGLAPGAREAEVLASLPYEGVPGLGPPTVAGHQGELSLRRWGGLPVLIFRGRYHYYERGEAADTLIQGAVAARLGARVLLLTNAAGGLDPGLEAGDLMAVSDHLDLQFRRGGWPARPVPPVGIGAADLRARAGGARFAYDPEFLSRIREAAREAGVPLHVGVLVAVSGPCYETAAEVRLARAAGARAATMSTVPEAEGAELWGLRVGAVSTISNVVRLAPEAGPLDHEEVVAAGSLSSRRLDRLLGPLFRGLAASWGVSR